MARRQKSRLSRAIHSRAGQRAVAGLVNLTVGLARSLGRERGSAFAGALMRRLAPLSAKNRLAVANIAAAFPEMPEARRRRILAGAWDNLGRSTLEFFFIEEFVDGYRPDDAAASTITLDGAERARTLLESGKPSLVFTGHLANGELLAALFTRIGIPLTILFRAPNNAFIGEQVFARREALAGEWVATDRSAARALGSALKRGRTVVISVDHRVPGAPILPFLGRPAHCTDVVARLARTFDCPVYSARGIRRPDGRLHVEFAGPLELPRDSEGRVDVAAANRMIHGTIEGWVREHPDQYLWQHNRWRVHS